MEDQIVTYIKAVDKQYFDRFVFEGQICMNTVKWFREYESKDSNIGDLFEGVTMACGNGFKISFAVPIEYGKTEEELNENPKSVKLPTDFTAQTLRMYDNHFNANIFSLFAIGSSNIDKIKGDYLVPPKFAAEFNNHRFVLFLAPDSIISRINEELFKLNKPIAYGLVRYYPFDGKFRKNLTLFDKPDKYEYQNEFRIVIQDDNAVTKIFNIGPINDVCCEIDLSKKYIMNYDETSFSIRIVDDYN